MDYAITSRAYLERALSLLERNSREELFYAAFELRCGVEARMEEYLEAWKDITSKKKHGWQIQSLARDIESTFRMSDKVVRMAIHQEIEGACLVCFYYTPVRKSLQQAAEKLGNYMHSKKHFHNKEHEWWHGFRVQLKETAAALAEATTGTLLGPPLYKPATGSGTLKIELPEGSLGPAIDSAMKVAVQRSIRIEYLTELPKVLEPEAHFWRPSANRSLNETDHEAVRIS